MQITRELPNIEKAYNESVVESLMKRFNYANKMEVPKLVKIVVNMGVGRASEDAKILEDAMKDLTAITGRKPVMRRAKKSVSNFKIREGMPIGCSVTLRKTAMYEFMDRLIAVVLPRIRDFRGISPKGFDSTGNYSFGLKEQSLFPEIATDKVSRTQGMDITFVTTAKTRDEALALLILLGVPFRDKDKMLTLESVN